MSNEENSKNLKKNTFADKVFNLFKDKEFRDLINHKYGFEENLNEETNNEKV